MKTLDELTDLAIRAQSKVADARRDYDDWAVGKRPDLVGKKLWKELEIATKAHLYALLELQEAKHAEHLVKMPREGELAQLQAMLQRVGIVYKLEENTGPKPRAVQIILESDSRMAAAVFTFNADGTLARFEVCT